MSISFAAFSRRIICYNKNKKPGDTVEYYLKSKTYSAVKNLTTDMVS